MLKATVVGNIGSEPQMQFTPNGHGLLRFSVASNYRTKGPGGEWKDATEWVRVAVFGKRAETLSQYLVKGTRVYVDGRLEARPWTDRSGNVQAGLELTASDVEFVSSRNGSAGNDDADTPF